MTWLSFICGFTFMFTIINIIGLKIAITRVLNILEINFSHALNLITATSRMHQEEEERLHKEIDEMKNAEEDLASAIALSIGKAKGKIK